MDKDILRNHRLLLQRILRQFRREKDIQQEELAERLRIHQSYVSKYETGGKRLDFVEVLLICEALGVSPSELLRRFKEQVDTCDQTNDSSD